MYLIRYRQIIVGAKRLTAPLVGVAPWGLIRSFGNIKYFNISYGVLFAVPIAHELYERAVPFMTWLLGAPSPFPSTLRWIYAASLSYALAIALYQIFCPSEVKRFGSPDEYVDAQHEIFLRAHPQHRESIVLANLDRSLDRASLENIERLHRRIADCSGRESQDLRQQLDGLILSLHPDAVQRFLIKDYEQKNKGNTAIRWLAFSLYMAGTLTLLTLLAGRSYDVLTQ